MGIDYLEDQRVG